MSAPEIDRPTQGTASTSASGVSSRTNVRGIVVVIVAIAALAALATGLVVDHIGDNNARTAQRARDEREALTDLNNRVDTQELKGKFTATFYVGDQMRARWVRNDKLKSCVMPVKPPTDKVKRWTAQDVKADKAVLANIEDTEAIGGVEAVPCGGIGNG